MICYRIVDVKDGNLLSLFHGTNGSRVLPIGKWVAANKKIVSDGGKNQYISGFHVFKSEDKARESFLKMFRRRENRMIARCDAVGLRRKARARGEVYLADRIKIIGLVE